LGVGVSLDLAFDDGQLAIADAVAHFCAERFDDEAVRAATGTLPKTAWKALAELGVLGVLTPGVEGGLLEAVAAVESLGAAVFPGPLAATFLATRVLDDPERAAVADGDAIVSAGAAGLWPWGCEASVFLELAGERVYRVEPSEPLEAVVTLGGEPWARASLVRGEPLERSADGLCAYRTLLAAQLAALGQRLVRDASAHAAARKQFGRPIGDFQAVAHPLADSAMRLDAAATLAHAAASSFDAGTPQGASRFAAAAHASACAAALEAAYVCHQVFGAVGITLEGPVFHVSRRIRQLASLAPGPAASAALLTGRGRPGGEGPRA
jgi:alkylation response protein AidB-like acyl-CoA dehydrogenase